MTDKTASDVTDDDRELARKWAEDIESATNSVEPATNPWSDRARAAARVILDAVPAPAPPTMADMTNEERDECLRMQADVKGVSIRAVIVSPLWEVGIARVMSPGGFIDEIEWREITPRPDLPRMEWPGTEKAAPAPAPSLPEGWRLADHENHGRVIVTTSTPDDDGDVYFIFPFDDLTGYDWDACRPDELTYLAGEQAATE